MFLKTFKRLLVRRDEELRSWVRLNPLNSTQMFKVTRDKNPPDTRIIQRSSPSNS
ncbi:hypothetical protein J6590_096065 [Homalodisca vitripennis]|nr:hypothetical protein J6590_096065 [Homalodisca vitripennis]